MNIGFVGYSATKFDESKAKTIITKVFDGIEKVYNKEEITIVSGATNLGIPKLVYEEAKKRKLFTVGVMCKEGYECELFPCDVIYAYGDNWGDESKNFIEMIDVIIRIGGGEQSFNEVKMAKEQNKIVYEFDL